MSLTWKVLHTGATATLIEVTTKSGATVFAAYHDVAAYAPAADAFDLLLGPAIDGAALVDLRDDVISWRVGGRTSHRVDPACDWATPADIDAAVERANAARKLAKQLQAVAS